MNVKREAFADEASWLEFQRNQAELARRERASQHTAKQVTHAPRKGGRSWHALRKIKNRELSRRRRENTPVEIFRRYTREHYQRHGERVRAHVRAYYWANREELLLRDAVYREENRAKINARDRARRAAKPGYISQTERLARAVAAEQEVVQLRESGFTFPQIATRLSKSVGMCDFLYRRAMKRQQQKKEDRS